MITITYMGREFQHGDSQVYIHALQVVPCWTGHLENLVKRRLKMSSRKHRKFMMLLIALAIIVNPWEIKTSGSDPGRMRGLQWLALSFQRRNGMKIFTCPKEPYFTLSMKWTWCYTHWFEIAESISHISRSGFDDLLHGIHCRMLFRGSFVWSVAILCQHLCERGLPGHR